MDLSAKITDAMATLCFCPPDILNSYEILIQVDGKKITKIKNMENIVSDHGLCRTLIITAFIKQICDQSTNQTKNSRPETHARDPQIHTNEDSHNRYHAKFLHLGHK